jgi:hypothetical protein
VREESRKRPYVKYTEDASSEDSIDSEGEQEQLARFQRSLGIKMCAADPGYIIHEDDCNRGDVM